MAVEYIGSNAPDGSCFGLTTTEKISFYGVTPVTQQSGSSALGTTNASAVSVTASTSTTPYGYATTTQADAIPVALNLLVTRMAEVITTVNAIRASLRTNGLLS
jgi:hypothetical protein